MGLHFLQGFIEEMGNLEQIPLDFLHLLDIAFPLGVPLADLLYLACLDLDHLVLHLQLLLIISCMNRPLSLLFSIDVAMFCQGYFLLAFNHLVVLIEGYKFSVVEV